MISMQRINLGITMSMGTLYGFADYVPLVDGAEYTDKDGNVYTDKDGNVFTTTGS